MTLSEECRLHGLMMPMPDAGRCCWYCAHEMGGSALTPEEIRLTSLYGTCDNCGAPRNARMAVADDGNKRYEMFCTRADLAT